MNTERRVLSETRNKGLSLAMAEAGFNHSHSFLGQIDVIGIWGS